MLGSRLHLWWLPRYIRVRQTSQRLKLFFFFFLFGASWNFFSGTDLLTLSILQFDRLCKVSCRNWWTLLNELKNECGCVWEKKKYENDDKDDDDDDHNINNNNNLTHFCLPCECTCMRAYACLRACVRMHMRETETERKWKRKRESESASEGIKIWIWKRVYSC